MDEPTTIARYRLTGELGRGGMGVVYRAEDPQLGREVAIKVILFPPHATDDFRGQLEKRFEREARAAAGIHHPGVVTVFDFGRDGDYLYLVMELVKGESLADRLEGGWRPERAEAFEIVAQVADGLAAAHAAGVVHRDVTPRNILLAEDGRVKVTDFGIARSLGEETLELTSTGMLVGSPSFMAPEQVRSLDFDERADLFSLGVVLYRLLVGELPFKSKDLTSLLYQIVHEDPLQGTQIQGQVGLGARGFLGKCLAKAPEDRIQTADELAADARRLKAEAEATELEETVALGQLKPAASGRPSRSRSRMGVWLGLAVVLVITVAIWLVSSFFRPEAPRTASGQSVTRREVPPAGEAPRPSPPPAPGVPANGSEDEPGPGTGEAEETPSPALAPPQSAPPRTPEAGQESTASPEEPRPRPEAEPAPPVRPAEVEPPLDRSLEDERLPSAAEAGLPAASPPPPADTVAPVLAIDSQPREDTSSEIVLSGRVMDDRDRSRVVLTVNGEPVAVEDTGEFVTERQLEPGRNRLTVEAADTSGNRTMRTIDVTMEVAEAASGPAAGPEAAGGPAGPGGGPIRPRFADRGDGTLVDTLTHLAWAKRPSDEILVWKASKTYCKKLELGRQDDWILPTMEELEELFLAGSRLGSESSPVWSSSKHSSGAAWAFDFAQGQRLRQAVSAEQGSGPMVLCVRRPPRQDDRRSQPLDPGFGTAPQNPRVAAPPPPRGGGAPPPPPRGGGGQGNPPGGGGSGL